MTFRLRLAAAALSTVLIATAAVAQDIPKLFSCSFKSGSSLSYVKGLYKSAPARPIGFEITDIDLDGQRATLLTDNGKGTLRVVRAINANHFLEVVAEGFLNMTTIYDKDPERGVHPAVHSRHFGLFGEPVVAQYHGFCTAK